MEYVAEEAEKLGIKEFEKKNRLLAFHLFTGEELTNEDKEMLAYILSSGTYGNKIRKVQNVMRARGWGKLRYALSRFLVPVSREDKEYESCVKTYPIFYKYKILLPVLPFYRTIRALKSGRLKEEISLIKQVNQQKR